MEENVMTPFAWFFMLLSMGSVTSLMVYCFARILRDPKKISSAAGSDPGGGDS